MSAHLLTRRTLALAAALVAAAALAGCGTTDPMADAGCTPLSTTADGTPVETYAGQISCTEDSAVSYVILTNRPDVYVDDKACDGDTTRGCYTQGDGWVAWVATD